MKLLGIGSKFDSGVVVCITTTHVLLDDGRRVTHADVEKSFSKEA